MAKDKAPDAHLLQQIELLYRKNARLEAQRQELATKLTELQDKPKNKYLKSLENLQKIVQQNTVSQVLEFKYGELSTRRQNANATVDAALANENAALQRDDSLYNAMMEQERDSSWSDTAVNQITDAMKSISFQGFSLVSVDCKATLCIVEASHESFPDMQK